MQYDYPLDLTGIAETNLVKGEPQVITDVNGSFSQIIIPDYAPFYLDNLALEHISTDGTRTTLTKDIDYFVAYPYQDLARESGKLAFGGLVIINKNANGRFKVTYQTIGDKWVANSNYVKEILYEKAYNPRIAYWDSITNVQDKFPPVDHSHDITESDKWPALLEAIQSVARAIANRNFNESSIYPTVVNYLDNFLPSLITKEAVGLADVENVQIATADEVSEKKPLRKLITLDNLLSLVDSSISAPVNERFSSLTAALDVVDRALGTLATEYRGFLATDAASKLELSQDISLLNNEYRETVNQINNIRDQVRIMSEDAYVSRQQIEDRFHQVEVAAHEATQQVSESLDRHISETTQSLGYLTDRVVETSTNLDSLDRRIAQAETNIVAANEAIAEQVAKGATVPTPFTFFLAQ